MKKAYDEEKIRAIAEKIREKTGGTTTYTTEDMPSGVNEVYDAGKNQGIEDGKQAEYDVFWDVLQGEGTRFSYYFAFCGLWDSALHYGWNDDIYNPKYPIILGDGKKDQTVFGQQVFYYNTEITDTKVDIIVNISELKNTFVNAYNLKTIRKIKLMRDNISLGNCFTNCRALENITFEGVIGSSIDLQWSEKLSRASIENIISCLSTSTSGLSVTLSKAAVNLAFGSAESDEWKALVATKSNWTISLV